MNTSSTIDPDLGAPLAEFRPSWLSFWILEIFLLAMAAGGLWMFSLGRSVDAAIVVAIGLLLGLGMLISALRYDRGRHVVIYDGGLVSARGPDVTTLRWGEIAWLRFVSNAWIRSGLEIGLHDGSTVRLLVTLDPVTRRTPPGALTVTSLAELIAGVSHFAGPVLLDAAIARYNSGEPVDFGQLQIGTAGLQAAGELVPWAEVEEIDALGDSIVIARAGRAGVWRRFRHRDLRNPLIFEALLEHAQGNRFHFVRDLGQSRVVRALRARSKLVSTVSFCAVIAAPFVLMFGWFAMDLHDWNTNARRHIDSGYCCLEKDPAEALASFERALAIEPGSLPARCGQWGGLQAPRPAG